MGKKSKRGIKKRNGSKSNRSTNSQTSGTAQTPKPVEPPPQIPPTTALSTPQKDEPKRDNFLNRAIFGSISLILALIGIFGYSELWPTVGIDASPAVDKGFISYQFTFANQAIYPVKVVALDTYPIKMSWTYKSGGVSDMDGLRIGYPNIDAKINGHESITLKIDDGFRPDEPATLDEGSKIIIKISYKLPLIRSVKTDSALFEVARDISGNPIWIKKEMGKYVNYSATNGYFYTRKLEAD